jgi:photosynthetic reaction center H subunit
MQTGAITQYIDVAQVALYGFWIFFAGLIWYLHREDKREGYPLDSERSDRTGGRVKVQGWPAIPEPKTFRLADGTTIQAPTSDGGADRRPIAAKPVGHGEGAPLQPTGDPMLDAVGPASYAANRPDKPERMIDGSPMIVPMRSVKGWSINKRDPDPRGMTVIGCDSATAGTVKEVWVDKAEPLIRYLEVELQGGKHVMLPYGFVRYDAARRQVKVASITAAQFANVPATRSNEQITMLEEDKITGYYGGGHLYATPDRLGPVL